MVSTGSVGYTVTVGTNFLGMEIVVTAQKLDTQVSQNYNVLPSQISYTYIMNIICEYILRLRIGTF